MIKDQKTMTLNGVFTINCPNCGVCSYIGFNCTDQVFQDASHGLMGFARRQDGLVDASSIPDWAHCPACDHSLNSDDHDLKDIITDTTKPVQP